MTRRATIRTAHADPDVVAAALAPDNTDEMATRVERVGDGRPTDAAQKRVVTTIERDSTGGLQATVDDTLVNLAVADEVSSIARSTDEARGRTGDSTTRSTREPTPSEDASTDDASDVSQQTTDTTNTTHE